MKSSVFPVVLGVWLLGAGRVVSMAAEPVDFNRDIRPLLSDNCFLCHGPDSKHRKADLRLDIREGAFSARQGGAVLVPGQPEGSALVRRVFSRDPDEQMPPPDSGKSLEPAQRELLRRWVSEGAVWQGHWAFESPRRPLVQQVENGGWGRNAIDAFILRRLKSTGLEPMPEAEREILIRRASLTLTGLPPTPAEVDAFLADDRPGAYERVVDRLLRSPAYGEHRARYWLDAARYGDTHGLHLDNERSLWPYRDWVIDAFNDNQPFDAFTIEQLAGDLLPEPTRDQLIATGFNRCNVTTSEGGSIPEEYHVRYTVDRTATMATVWMGLTAGCAVCHDHKYDPLAMDEFYSLYAYFNSIDENPMDGNALNPPPVLPLPTPEEAQRMSELKDGIAAARRALREAAAKVEYQDPKSPEDIEKNAREDRIWIDDALPRDVKSAGDNPGWLFREAGAGVPRPVSGSRVVLQETSATDQVYFTGAPQPLVVGAGDTLFMSVWLDPENPPTAVMLQFNNGSWTHRAFWGAPDLPYGRPKKGEAPFEDEGYFQVGELPETGHWVRLEVPVEKVGLKKGDKISGWACSQQKGRVYWDAGGLHTRTYQEAVPFRSQLAWEAYEKPRKKSDVPSAILKLIKLESGKRTPKQIEEVRRYFLENIYAANHPVLAPLLQEATNLEDRREALDKGIVRTMIMKERAEPEETFVLIRGQYDTPGQQVTPGVPAALSALPEGAPSNRLGLARWLVDPRHPLTARVTVNRFWQQHFGVGLVKTSEDFGAQGEVPSHPELLDWLAVEFMDSGWNVKHLHRLIVLSATYRQASAVTPEGLAKDPENRLLSRGPSWRLDAEMLRDQALFVGGLLVPKTGGHGVKPYQPEGLWESVGYPSSNTSKFKVDDGAALYRRSLYTFWKRTSPPPAMTAFDAPSREACTVRRERTNTPLQALVLMNDPQFVEASQQLAARMWREGGGTVAGRLEYGFRLVTGRRPVAEELQLLVQTFERHRDGFQSSADAPDKLRQADDSPATRRGAVPEMAAATLVANLLLNLDEALTVH